MTIFGRVPHAVRPRGVGVGAVALVAALGACTPTPGPGPDPTGATTITGFTVSAPSGPAPHTVAFSWNISDPQNDPLTCTLDLTTDGTPDMSISPCTNASLRAHSYPSPGTFTATLVVSDLNSAVASKTATVTVGPSSSDPFAITLRLSAGMTPSQTLAFNDAAARWSEVVTAGLDARTISVPAGDCHPSAPAFSGTVDDLLIDGIIGPIDGPGGILGQAGPCYVRGASGLPIYGVMVFDSADVVAVEADGLLGDVILHEMGHVLGIGTLWKAADLGGLGTANPTYLKAASRAAYSMLGASGNVPLENTGGPGTAESHWRESLFGRELMTGFIDTTNRLSIQTVANLADLGYSGVNLAAADSYTLGPSARRTAPTPPLDLNEVLLTPRRTI